MSINPVTDSSDPQLQAKYEQYNQQYQEYKDTYESLIANDNYKSYFSESGDLKKLKEELEEKLEDLKNALSTYNEDVIDELMQALGTLLAASASMMGLEARIQAYRALLELAGKGWVTEEDYTTLLARLNSLEVLTEAEWSKLLCGAKLEGLKANGLIIDTDYEVLVDVLNAAEDFDKSKFEELLTVALSRKESANFLERNRENLGASKYQQLKGKIEEDFSGLSEKTIEQLQSYNKEILDLKFILGESLISSVTALHETRRTMQLGGLSMKVIQANNAYRDIESQLKAAENLDDRAKLDEKMKRLRDEGVWADTTARRRQENLQEEALQKARNAEQKAKRENI